MSFCSSCGAQVSVGSAFCSKCGTRQGSAPARTNVGENRNTRPARQPWVPALSTEVGKRHYEQMMAEKHAKARRRAQIGLSLAGIALVWLIALQFLAPNNGQASGWAIAFLVGFLAIGILGNPNKLDEYEYYTIPGSRDAENGHRCISCGHRGIYRKGEYKSNVVEAECSKCKQYLWHESK